MLLTDSMNRLPYNLQRVGLSTPIWDARNEEPEVVGRRSIPGREPMKITLLTELDYSL
jgi:hypothetical protein